ncbi:MAG: hypothetical protein KAS02_02735 [Candidatus Pacebacteria bacterium]|nr:hypothetical protein [Candidatus Paceibacterota bacterium]
MRKNSCLRSPCLGCDEEDRENCSLNCLALKAYRRGMPAIPLLKGRHVLSAEIVAKATPATWYASAQEETELVHKEY